MILLNKHSRIITIGITGKQGSFHTEKCLEYGSHIIGGVTPLKGGSKIFNLPVYNSVRDLQKHQGDVDVSLIFVPAPYALDALYESLDANIPLIVCITEGIPVKDMLLFKKDLYKSGSLLIGPNCPGIISPGESKVGIMPGSIHKKGSIGVISRSGTLTYEAVHQLTEMGLGQSTCIGIGGDPVIGMNYIDCLEKFNEDPETEAVLMIGEIGGQSEVLAGEWVKKNMKKPVFSFIAGSTAPKGKRMGHAGAIVSGGEDTVERKFEKLKKYGITLIHSLPDIGRIIKKTLH